MFFVSSSLQPTLLDGGAVVNSKWLSEGGSRC